MPKKPIQNRLENLFLDLEREAAWQTPALEGIVTGWAWECDAQGNYLTCGVEVEAILGILPQEFIGQSLFHFALQPESAVTLSTELPAGVQAGHNPGPLQVKFLASDGRNIPIRLNIQRQPDLAAPDPSIQRWEGFSELIPSSLGRDQQLGETARQVSSRPVKAVRPVKAKAARPGKVELPAAGPPPSKPQTAGAPAGPAAILPHEAPFHPGAPLTPDKAYPTAGKRLRARRDAYPSGAALTRAGRDSLRLRQPVLQNGRAGEPAVLALPAKSGEGEPDLLLEIFDEQENRRWSRDDCLLVEQIADQLAIALENARLFSENLKMARAVEAAADMVVITDLDGMIQFVNPAFEQVTGYTQIEALGQNLRTLNGEPLDSRLYHEIWTVVLGGQTWRGEVQNQRKEGSFYHAQLAISPIIDERGMVVQFVAIQRDISEQKRAQAERERLLHNTETLYQASARLNAASGFEEILDILRQSTILGYPQATYISLNLFDRPWKATRPPDRMDSLACWCRQLDTEALAGHISLADWPNAGQLMRPDRAVVVADPASDARLDSDIRPALVEGLQSRCLLFSPLSAAGQWTGHIIAAFEQSIDFSDSEVRRLISLAGQAAICIDNIRLLAETRQRNEELAAINAIIGAASRSLDLKAMLGEVLDQVLATVPYEAGLIAIADPVHSTLTLAVQRSIPEPLLEQMQQKGWQDSLCELVYRRGEAAIVADFQESAPVDVSSLLSQGLRSHLGVPLSAKGQILGALCVFGRTRHDPSPAQLSLMQAVGQQLGVAIENARAYELVQQAVEEVRKVDWLKSQFLANMSHELHTPLNSIIGFSRVILKGIDGPITDQQQQDLTAIYNSGKHLLNLINDILDLSKIEAGKMELAIEENVNAAELIESALSTVSGLINDRPIKFEQEVGPDLPPLKLDPVKIRQVLINLLSNAVKFTQAGVIKVSASETTGSDGRPEIRFSVFDTGPGISLEDQQKLFLPFSQIEPSLTRKLGGTGLGLSISRQLVEMHRGRIGVESEVGQGSTFYFLLPAAASHP